MTRKDLVSAQGMNQAPGRRIRFGQYEADLAAGELRKNGRPVRLQEQPFLVMAALLDRAGEVVTREELRERLWPGDSFGDFDQGLNTAINKLREALGDSAANPRFIETLPKRGYRFTHPLEAEPAVSSVGVAHVGQQWWPAPKLLVPIAAILAIGTFVFAVLWIRRPAHNSQLPLRRFSIRGPATVGMTPSIRLVAISPNGRHIAFVGGEGAGRLWIHDLDRAQRRVVEGSEGAISPFWSPDSKMIGFTSTGKLRKVSATGGPVITLCDMPDHPYVSGGSWSPDGDSIVFAAGSPSSLYIVPAAGGAPTLLVSPQMLDYRAGGEEPERRGRAFAWIVQPHFLSAENGSAALLFTYFSDKSVLILRDFKTGHHRVLGPGSNPFYSSTGHLVYRAGTDLWCRRFSPKQSQFTGEAFRVARNAADPTIAADGTLVYRDEPTQQLVWLDRSGARIEALRISAKRIFYPTLSSDGHRVAAEFWDEENLDVWVSDLLRATRIRLTSHPATDILPVWAPDGDSVAFSSYRAGNTDILLRRADAGSDETTLAAMPTSERVSDWSHDGQYILYSLQHPRNGHDLWYLKRNADGRWESYPLLETSFNEKCPKLSPDGRFVAYLSDESGRNELYVRPFPTGGRKWPISSGGAAQIRWSRRSGELFYTEAHTLIAVGARTMPEFAVGATTRLFSHAGFTDVADSNYDVSADGQRVLLPEKVETEEPMIHVVQNWFAEFQRR